MRGKIASVIDTFTSHGYEVTVRTTQARMDACAAAEYACLCGKFDLLVCSGGDGTLNEVVQGLVHSQSPLPLGYIPCGSTNDFAKGLGIPSDIEEAAEWLMDDPHHFICDVGAFNSNYFLYVAAFGAFTSTVYETKQNMKNVLGHMAYILHGISQLPSIRPLHLKFEHDGITEEDDFIYGMVANTASVGGLLKLKNFKLDDGIFEVMLVRKPKDAMEMQHILASLIKINEDINPNYVLYFRTDRIRFVSNEEIPWTLDGEYGGVSCNTEIKILHRAITFNVGTNGPFNDEIHGALPDKEYDASES